MKSLRWMILAVIGVLALLPATAAAETLVLRVEVPFEFLAGDQALPAGQYMVTIEPGQVVLSNPETHARLVLAHSSFAYRSDAQSGRLQFATYGDTHILRKVWNPGDERGALLPAPKSEREAMAKFGNGFDTQIAAVPVLTR